MILLPGWAASAFTFRYQLPALAAAGYRAVSVDLKGLGFSDKPTRRGQYTLDAMMQHVEEVVSVVAPRPAVIVGQSMAGALALELALSRPTAVTAVVLVSPVGIGVVPFIGLARLVSTRLFVPVVRQMVRRGDVRVGVGVA